MVELRISKYLLRYLLQEGGLDRHQWEKLLSGFCGFPVKIPRFFWEVELYVRHGAKPPLVHLICHVPPHFPGLDGRKEIHSRLRRHVLGSIYREVSLGHSHSSNAITNGSDRIPLALPSHNDEFREWGFAPQNNRGLGKTA